MTTASAFAVLAVVLAQAAESGALDGGDVDENILGSIIGPDESEALRAVEKFHNAVHIGLRMRDRLARGSREGIKFSMG
jgi:hypothetical protein